MRIWLSVHDQEEAIESDALIQELYAALRSIETFATIPIFVITKSDMDTYFHNNRLHDLPSLTAWVRNEVKDLPLYLQQHNNGWDRFMAFRSYPNEKIHSISFRI